MFKEAKLIWLQFNIVKDAKSAFAAQDYNQCLRSNGLQDEHLPHPHCFNGERVACTCNTRLFYCNFMCDFFYLAGPFFFYSLLLQLEEFLKTNISRDLRKAKKVINSNSVLKVIKINIYSFNITRNLEKTGKRFLKDLMIFIFNTTPSNPYPPKKNKLKKIRISETVFLTRLNFYINIY